ERLLKDNIFERQIMAAGLHECPKSFRHCSITTRLQKVTRSAEATSFIKKLRESAGGPPFFFSSAPIGLSKCLLKIPPQYFGCITAFSAGYIAIAESRAAATKSDLLARKIHSVDGESSRPPMRSSGATFLVGPPLAVLKGRRR